jgi:hypothetical protein
MLLTGCEPCEVINMTDIYTDQIVTLSRLTDSVTGEKVIIDLTNATLPARRNLKKAGDAGRELAAKVAKINTKAS